MRRRVVAAQRVDLAAGQRLLVGDNGQDVERRHREPCLARAAGQPRLEVVVWPLQHDDVAVGAGLHRVRPALSAVLSSQLGDGLAELLWAETTNDLTGLRRRQWLTASEKER